MQKTNKNLEIIKEFKESLNLREAKFFLFGSRSKGNFNTESDFDILIISDSFKDVSWHKRAVLFQLAWKDDIPLEVLCFTKEETAKLSLNRRGIVREAIKTGIEI